MFKRFHDSDSLCQFVEEDKRARGMEAANLDRYPIRFVLFDNFRDSYAFVDYLLNERHIHVESVDKWIDASYPDLIITQAELASRIDEHIKKKSPNDCVIAPFSELARFYDNNEKHAFDALLKTIKAIEASPKGVENHQRVYIPIVGLEGKMETFAKDTQINIWQLTTEEKDINYRLIVTKNTDFGVKGLEENYTIVSNIREWLNLWKDGKNVRPQIICKSKAIFANAIFAQPDNAFSYEICHNEYEFLVHGLQLSLGGVQPQAGDEENWAKLARDIDVSKGFNFSNYVQNHFEVNDIEDYKDFIRLWFSHPQLFDHWLLARYYADFKQGESYICEALGKICNYSTTELVERVAITFSEIEKDMAIRSYFLKQAIANHVLLSEATESHLAGFLSTLPAKMGYTSALKYFTGISRKEKEIAIKWLGHGNIHPSDVKAFFPDLYDYIKEGVAVSAGVPGWVEDYMSVYKRAKICNQYTADIAGKIDSLNASAATFDTWYNEFSTTYTCLKDRKDIEVFYWMDGLGVDWIPLVKQIVAEKKEQQIFLNEIKIARAKLPSKTDINKTDLSRLLPKGKSLEKCGDLDALAHQQGNISPFSLIDEIETVRKSIEEVLRLYIGKKIAIVSDHGLTYLSQLVPGKNLAGVESDHHGRVAKCSKASSDSDNSYVRLEDGKTLCALRHQSLCAKVPSGQGSHGGCTPEEVLVPIFIISSSPSPTNWTASLVTMEVNGSKPRVQFLIKNIPSTDNPFVVYNNQRYEVHHVSGDIYETADLVLDPAETTITLQVGEVMKIMKIELQTGVKEDDLFNF